MKRLKKIAVITVISLLVFFTALLTVHFILNKPFSWEPLSDVKDFAPLFEEEIKEIKLIDTIDIDTWAEFDDEDLIKTWLNYLSSLEVKAFFSPLPVSCGNSGSLINDGGTGNVVIKTENGEYRLWFAHKATLMKFNDKYYDIRGEMPFPYQETYDTAIQRHGAKSPWSWNNLTRGV